MKYGLYIINVNFGLKREERAPPAPPSKSATACSQLCTAIQLTATLPGSACFNTMTLHIHGVWDLVATQGAAAQHKASMGLHLSGIITETPNSELRGSGFQPRVEGNTPGAGTESLVCVPNPCNIISKTLFRNF